MANNRLYLKCIDCGATLFLGKTFLDGYYTNGLVDVEGINKFFDEHKYCHEGEIGPFSDGDFKLEYEFPYECPHCQGAVDPGDKFCRSCGKNIEAEWK